MLGGKVNRIGVIYEDDKVFDYAVEELKLFLTGAVIERTDDEGCSAYGVCFKLLADNSMKEMEFEISSGLMEKSGGIITQFRGYDQACVLQSVYTMLEKMGIRFEISGPVMPEKLDFSVLENMYYRVVPAVKYRGIRQHINFPMDVSSYALLDAREYIRNLARLKMNCITFHSYPGQWYECKLDEKEILAGGFFYGQVHDIPGQHFIKDYINNNKTFCIPEIEAFFEDSVQKSKAAVQWLKEVMDEAKKAGMKVHFSIELRDGTLDENIKICDGVVDLYPMMDTFELITQECGAWAYPVLPKEELESMVKELFGDEILDDGKISAILKDACGGAEEKSFVETGIWQLPGTLKELAAGINTVNELLKSKDNYPGLALGIYATDHYTLKIVRIIIERFLPDNVSFSLLPAHGSKAVVDSLRAMDMDRELLKKSMIYSWIEFDGSMYLQQNAIEGIGSLIEFLDSRTEGEPIEGICLNHWRTAENRITAAYSAAVFMEGFIKPEDFYTDYSRKIGIKEYGLFCSAMELLSCVDNEVRTKLPNIGFCFAGCWWSKGLGYFELYKKSEIEEISEKYASILELLHKCKNGVEDSDSCKYLEFLINRVECSIIHLNVVDVMTGLQEICGSQEPSLLTQNQKKEVESICCKAIQLADRYMEHHSKIMPDRGCQGTLISYYHTLPVVISKVKEYYTKGYVCTGTPDKQGDAPPSPAI